jgi:hypothetical protein
MPLGERKTVNATLFAFVYNAAFALILGVAVLAFRRSSIARWIFCLITFVSAIALWLLMLVFLSYVLEPHLELTNEGHAGGNFVGPYLLLGISIVLVSPLIAYLVSAPNGDEA